MSYATRADIEALYGGDELRGVLNLARDAELSPTDTARVDQALTESASQIDAYIGPRYTLPLPTVPDVLRGFAIDMTIYRLALRNGRPRDELRTRYEDAIKFLGAVGKGHANLPGVDIGATSSDAASGSSDDVQFVNSPRRANRSSGLMT